jgi:hypothetical protein
MFLAKLLPREGNFFELFNQQETSSSKVHAPSS